MSDFILLLGVVGGSTCCFSFPPKFASGAQTASDFLPALRIMGFVPFFPLPAHLPCCVFILCPHSLRFWPAVYWPVGHPHIYSLLLCLFFYLLALNPAGSHWPSTVSLLYCTFHLRIPLGSKEHCPIYCFSFLWHHYVGASLLTEADLRDAGSLHLCTLHCQSKGDLGSNPNRCILVNHSNEIPRVFNSWIDFVTYPVWPPFYVVFMCALTEFSLKLGYGTSSAVFKVRSSAQRSLWLPCYASPY